MSDSPYGSFPDELVQLKSKLETATEQLDQIKRENRTLQFMFALLVERLGGSVQFNSLDLMAMYDLELTETKPADKDFIIYTVRAPRSRTDVTSE